ncbi:fructoselysine 6-kinase [Caproicibacterium sp. BJN0003]|uniref:fructoselysine 6-kinase n=1 Tax=Caproicibacterium sp. BJN0003 TaxID=2994078 RepID=UPI002258D286|nr:fructoselysine 6-kinase [Caproicibacterium sp. BJN0003]UZT81942.1 fructoselysine 6-kinase [Caproicibacterium sp. BJN0003]
MIRTIGIGDNVCDKYRHLSQMFPGGQALNFAVYCRMEKQQSAYLGAFGNDAVAAHVKHVLDLLGVDRSHCREYPEENGFAMVDLKNGDRVFITSNKGGALRNHPLVLSQEDLQYLNEFDVMHTSNNSYILEELPKLQKLNGILSYDFSGSWKDEEQTQKICPYLDAAFLSCSSLSKEEVQDLEVKMYGWGCGLITVTRGEKGAILYDGNRFYENVPHLVKAVDTLGAGDSFATGVLLIYGESRKEGLLQKDSEAYREMIKQALEKGAELSAKTCMTYGAFGYGTKMVP